MNSIWCTKCAIIHYLSTKIASSSKNFLGSAEINSYLNSSLYSAMALYSEGSKVMVVRIKIEHAHLFISVHGAHMEILIAIDTYCVGIAQVLHAP